MVILHKDSTIAADVLKGIIKINLALGKICIQSAELVNFLIFPFGHNC